MPEYRAFLIGEDGRFIGYEPLVCADDAEAIKTAKRFAGGVAVELWSGARLVDRIGGHQQKAAVTHEVHEGPMVPKAAK